jgi:hypothetical protein
MNYSEDADKNQNNSGFNDIIVDYSKKDDQQAQNIFSPGPLEVQGPPTDQTPSNFDSIILQSKIVKWTSLVLSVCCFIYLLAGAWPLVLTFVFPILGFIGAHKFHLCLIRFYLVYLCMILIIQIIVMAVLGGTAYIVFQCFVMLSEIGILIYDVKLSISINHLSTNQMLELKSKRNEA